jgi:hypothetical protein
MLVRSIFLAESAVGELRLTGSMVYKTLWMIELEGCMEVRDEEKD